jgi:hypothetical protein
VTELETIAQRIDGQQLGESVCGMRHGVTVLLSLTTRGSEDDVTKWTLVAADLPAKYPLELHVCEQDPSREREVARGLRVDITVGDPQFDAEYIIEAAPTDVACALLDSETRALVRVALVGRGCELATSGTEQRRLTLSVPGWLLDTERAMAAIELVTRIVSRVRDAFADEPAVQAAIYRDQPDGTAERELAEARRAEVIHVRDVRERRRLQMIAAGFGLVFLLALGFALALRACG